MDTKEKILKAAIDEFAVHGFRRATVRGICRRAGVNIAAVNYHFSGKDELYRQVFEHIVTKGRVHPPDPKRVTDQSSLEEELHSWIARQVARVVQRPNNRLDRLQGRIGIQEMIDPSELFEEFFERYQRRELAPLRELLRLGMPPDVSEDLVNLRVCHVFAQCHFYFVQRRMVELYTGGSDFGNRCFALIVDEIFKNTVRDLHYGQPATTGRD